MHTLKEKQEFADRLRTACASITPPITIPNELATRFTLLYRGKSITPSAIRKWWNGDSIPTEDKIEVLAKLLKVSADWLRYNAAPKTKHGNSMNEAATPEEIMLLHHWRSLPASRRKALMTLIVDLDDD